MGTLALPTPVSQEGGPILGDPNLVLLPVTRHTMCMMLLAVVVEQG